jgi:hypothetical protein
MEKQLNDSQKTFYLTTQEREGEMPNVKKWKWKEIKLAENDVKRKRAT